MTNITTLSRHASVTIATHNGSFHADDVFGVAVLQSLFDNHTVVRTRDPVAVRNATFAVDVGGVWDAESGRFDHHQKGFNGSRADGTLYASAGLVWTAYGEALVSRICPKLTLEQVKAVAKEVDDELVIHLDRADTGADAGAPGLFGLSALLAQFNTTWEEEQGLSATSSERLKGVRFSGAVAHVQMLLRLVIRHKAADQAAADAVRNGTRMLGGRLLMLNATGLNWEKVVCKEMPEVLFVSYPDSTDNQFQLRTVPVEPYSFVARADLPRAWAGLRDADLAAVTGVPDSVFCHNACFIAGAVSKDGVQALAKLALDAFDAR